MKDESQSQYEKVIAMPFKFEQLEVWKRSLIYIDLIDEIVVLLPKSEDYNLKSQIVRAATSVALNIAEGSTGQTDVEQARFLGFAIRSLVETVACQHIIHRHELLVDTLHLFGVPIVRPRNLSQCFTPAAKQSHRNKSGFVNKKTAIIPRRKIPSNRETCLPSSVFRLPSFVLRLSSFSTQTEQHP